MYHLVNKSTMELLGLLKSADISIPDNMKLININNVETLSDNEINSFIQNYGSVDSTRIINIEYMKKILIHHEKEYNKHINKNIKIGSSIETKLKKLIHLFYTYKEYSLQEICEKTGYSENSAKVRISILRKQYNLNIVKNKINNTWYLAK